MQRLPLIVCAAASLLFVTACAAAKPVVDSKLSPVDGVSMDVYLFDDGPQATRHHITNRTDVGKIISYLTRSKGKQVSEPDEHAHYESFVITLTNGSTVEALHAYHNPKTNWIWTEASGWVDVHYGGQLVGPGTFVPLEDTGDTVDVSQVPLSEHRRAS